MKSILIPTDFSPIADNALRYAINVAQKAGAALTIFHAYRIPLVVGSEAITVLPELEEDYEKSARSQLEALETNFPQLRNVRYEIQPKMGYLNDAIESLLEEKHAELIIMGTHGASGLSEMLGTRTTDVIDRIHSPVLVIPDQAVYKGIVKIAFAYDYKEMKNPGKLDILKSLAQIFKAELHILFVAKSEEAEPTEDFSALALVDGIFENIPHRFRVRIKDDVEKGISDYITEKSIDLLAVMPHKHGILDGLFNRSITKKLAYHSHIPLLVLQD